VKGQTGASMGGSGGRRRLTKKEKQAARARAKKRHAAPVTQVTRARIEERLATEQLSDQERAQLIRRLDR